MDARMRMIHISYSTQRLFRAIDSQSGADMTSAEFTRDHLIQYSAKQSHHGYDNSFVPIPFSARCALSTDNRRWGKTRAARQSNVSPILERRQSSASSIPTSSFIR